MAAISFLLSGNGFHGVFGPHCLRHRQIIDDGIRIRSGGGGTIVAFSCGGMASVSGTDDEGGGISTDVLAVLVEESSTNPMIVKISDEKSRACGRWIK